MTTQATTKEAERLDEKISELEKLLYPSTRPTDSYDSRLYEFYPKFMQDDLKRGKCVLLNGIDFDNLGQTDAAYFLSRDPKYVVPVVDHDAIIQVNDSQPGHVAAHQSSHEMKGANGKKMDVEDVNNKNEYCICRKNQSSAPDDVLIQCDNCNEWYHPFCLKVSRIEVALLNLHDSTMKWYCQKCLAFNN